MSSLSSGDLAKLSSSSGTAPDGTNQLVIALIKRYGLVGKPDRQAFLSELAAALKAGSADAAAMKANMLCGFEIGAPDYVEGARMFRLAAEKGNAYAQGQLGMLYALGFGVKHDWPSAIQWLTRGADKGDCESQYCLADFYCDGRGVKPDRKKCLALFKKAAEQGHEDACRDIGTLMQSSEYCDLTPDTAESAKWLKKSAALGLQESNYYLGLLLENSDPEGSVDAFEEAASNGHILSQIHLGDHFSHEGDLAKARAYYEMASKQGNNTAAQRLKRKALEGCEPAPETN